MCFFNQYNQPAFVHFLLQNLQEAQSGCFAIVNHKRSRTPSQKPVGRHHAYTHPGEWIEYEERERARCHARCGTGWQAMGEHCIYFFSCDSVQFSRAWYQDTVPNPNLRQPHFTIIPKPHESPTHKCAFPLSQCMLMHDAWFRCYFMIVNVGSLLSNQDWAPLSEVVVLAVVPQYSLASSSSFMNTSSWGFSGQLNPLLGGRTAWKRLQSPLHRIQGNTSTLKWSSGENSVLIRLGVPAPFPRVISCPRSL